MQKVQVLGSGVQRERVDGDGVLPQTQFDVPAVQKLRQLPVAVAEVEDDRERVVLLRAGDEEVEQEALAAAGGTEHQGVPDVFDVKVIVERRAVRRLEDRDRSRQQGGIRCSKVDGEQEAEVGRVGFEHGSAAAGCEPRCPERCSARRSAGCRSRQ